MIRAQRRSSTRWARCSIVGADVLVIGESLIDIVRSNDHLTRHPGGSALNVASGLGRLGVATEFVTALGRDADGELLVSYAEGSGVAVSPGSFSLARTGTARATLDEHGAATYEFDLAWMFEPPDFDGLPKFLHTGSLASFLNPGASAVADFLLEVGERAVVSYDPNIRPSLMPDHAGALAQFERFAALADVVKLSREDADWLYPRHPTDDVIGILLDLGPEVVVVTDGAAGARLAASALRVQVPAEPVTVVDTIGAGDSYTSALLAFLVRSPSLDLGDLSERTLLELGHWAARAAAITVSRAGAVPPTLAELTTPRRTPLPCAR